MIETQVPAIENSFWGKAVIFFFRGLIMYCLSKSQTCMNRNDLTPTLRSQNADSEESMKKNPSDSKGERTNN